MRPATAAVVVAMAGMILPAMPLLCEGGRGGILIFKIPDSISDLTVYFCQLLHEGLHIQYI